MRILYINDAWAVWGGLERVLIDKMNYLADDGYEIYTITYNQGTHPLPYPLNPKIVHRDVNVPLHHQYRYHGFKKYYYKYKLQRSLIKGLQSEIECIKPDVIVSPRIELVGYLLKVKGIIPLIYESHSSYKWIFYGYEGLLWNIKRYCYIRQIKKVQMIVALTEGDAKEWQKITQNVCVIPNIVNLNKSGEYSTCHSKSVIFVGRISKQKDIASLLRIWAFVHQCYPDWSLQIYGGCGEEQDSLLVRNKLLDANIQVHEPVLDILDKYKESSISILTSQYEPFGLVLPEAMSCGLPVVAFDCPYGPADIITDGIDGFLVHNRSIEEFVDKVCLLMENQELRVKMGKAGIISSHRYDANLIMPLWKQLFEQFIKYE